MICSKISSIPSPVFPEQGTAPDVSIPITSSICLFVLSMSDAGKSILFGQELSHDLYLELDTHLQEFGLQRPGCYLQLI